MICPHDDLAMHACRRIALGSCSNFASVNVYSNLATYACSEIAVGVLSTFAIHASSSFSEGRIFITQVQ